MNENKIYFCEICGNTVEFLSEKRGELICCGQPMKNVEFKTQDQGFEKHVPIIEKIENGFKVKVGSVPHPMNPDHFIEIIELIVGSKTLRKKLSPGENPEFDFCVSSVDSSEKIEARIFCNLHGWWKSFN